MSKRLSTALKRRAIAWAGQISKLAKAFAPNHLRPYIHSRVETKEDKTFIIRTTVSRKESPLPKYGSMDARAQEYGSGLKARRGAKAKYLIVPKTKKALAFYENAGGTWDYSRGMPQIYDMFGRGVFHQVMHPGIKAANQGKGYIGPAQSEVRRRGKAELKNDVRTAILGDLRESFGGRVK